MKQEIETKRFVIKVADEEYEADAYITLRSDVSGEQMGLTWIKCLPMGNVQGTPEIKRSQPVDSSIWDLFK